MVYEVGYSEEFVIPRLDMMSSTVYWYLVNLLVSSVSVFQAGLRNSLLLSILQQLLGEDREEAVRASCVRSLALIVAVMADTDKYTQVTYIRSLAMNYFKHWRLSIQEIIPKKYFLDVNCLHHIVSSIVFLKVESFLPCSFYLQLHGHMACVETWWTE